MSWPATAASLWGRCKQQRPGRDKRLLAGRRRCLLRAGALARLTLDQDTLQGETVAAVARMLTMPYCLPMQDELHRHLAAQITRNMGAPGCQRAIAARCAGQLHRRQATRTLGARASAAGPASLGGSLGRLVALHAEHAPLAWCPTHCSVAFCMSSQLLQCTDKWG